MDKMISNKDVPSSVLARAIGAIRGFALQKKTRTWNTKTTKTIVTIVNRQGATIIRDFFEANWKEILAILTREKFVVKVLKTASITASIKKSNAYASKAPKASKAAKALLKASKAASEAASKAASKAVSKAVDAQARAMVKEGLAAGSVVLTNITEKAPQSSSTLRKQLLKDELDKLNYSLPDEYSSSWETNWGFHQHATSMIPRLHVKKKFEETPWRVDEVWSAQLTRGVSFKAKAYAFFKKAIYRRVRNE